MKTFSRKFPFYQSSINLFFGFLFYFYCQFSFAAFIVALEEADNRPFEFVNHNGVLTGFHIELVNAICAELGWTPTFIRVPWGRANLLLANGEVNAVTYMSQNSTRQHFALFLHDNILSTMTATLYIRKEDANEIVYKEPLSKMMKQWRFGVAQDYAYSEDIDRLLKTDIAVDRSAFNQVQLFSMLLKKRIDIAIASSAEVMEVAKQTIPNIDQYIRPLDNVLFSGTPMYIAFSKKNKGEKLAAEFANAFRAFRKKPAYMELVNRYNLLSTAPPSL